MTLVIGATLSASTFGSHACFYSDATVLTAQASGCTPMQHALTQIPYALIGATITVAGFLALAYWRAAFLSVTLTSTDGTMQTINAGEAVTIPKEWMGTWDTDGYTKIWVIYSADGSGL